VLSIYDLDPHESLHASTRIRRHTGRPPVEPEELKQTLSLIGGRLSYLNKVGPIPHFNICFLNAQNTRSQSRRICLVWRNIYWRWKKLGCLAKSVNIGHGKQNFHFIPLTSLAEGLIPDCDDDVMDEVPLLSLVFAHPNSFPASFNSKNGAPALGCFCANLSSSVKNRRLKQVLGLLKTYPCLPFPMYVSKNS